MARNKEALPLLPTWTTRFPADLMPPPEPPELELPPPQAAKTKIVAEMTADIVIALYFINFYPHLNHKFV
jgi:hypothetical protein